MGASLGQFPELPITLGSGHLVVMAVMLMIRRLHLVLVAWIGITSGPLLLRDIRGRWRNWVCYSCRIRIGIGIGHLVSRRYRPRALALGWRASRCSWAIDRLSSTDWAGLCDGATVVHHRCRSRVDSRGRRRLGMGVGMLEMLLHWRLRRRVLRRITPGRINRSVLVAALSLVMPPLAEQEHQAQGEQRNDSHATYGSPNNSTNWSRRAT